ncbi:MAG TPA: hypothetical protein VKU00_21170 [Chthonomonadaceae bacterium]|nr:hypothetical protein [Chthonomonadaceae bacterium]
MKPVTKLGASLLVLAMWGCGGGGGNSPASSGNTAVQAFSYGALSGRAARINPPVLTNSSGVSVVGLTGVISALELRGTRDLANTKIALDSTRDGNSEIYVMNADGSNQTRLTNNPATDHVPVWSPDGSKIAFISNRDGNDEIYVMNADGSKPTRLTYPDTGGKPTFPWNPVWSPDGSKIAFERFLDGNSVGLYNGNLEIYVMNADGSNLTRLTHSSATDESPTWSPDGSKIAFNRFYSGHSGIYVMNADGSNQKQLTDNPQDNSPAWSPDGSKIAFRRYNGNSTIYVMNADGSNLTSLSPLSDLVGPPSWSPDGSKIAYNSFLDSHIYVINVDGSQLTSLTNNGGSPTWSPFILSRKLIGTGGEMGAAAGFLFSQVGNANPASIVTFNQTATALPLLLTLPSGLNSQGTALVYDLETADLSAPLTDVHYWNLKDPAPVQVALSNGLVATGALISFGSEDGLVHSVLLFNAANRSAGGSGHPQVTEANGQRVAKGHFVGVWDGKGKNLAPQGASEVRMDALTGKVLSVK